MSGRTPKPVASRHGDSLTPRAVAAVRAAAPAEDSLWVTLTRPLGGPEPLCLASYGAWLFVIAYGLMRTLSLQQALPYGPTAVIAVTRLIAALGIPFGVLGMASAVGAFVREERRLWLATGGFATCGLIVVFSYLELSGKLLGLLSDKLPGM